MKLNHECIRDILLYLEENLNYDGEIVMNNISLKSYSHDELLYTCEKLKEAGYINYTTKWNLQNTHIICISSITYNGHQFLDNIRDDAVWKDTKNVLSKFKSTSISFIADVSSQIIANIISNQLGFN